MPKPPSGCSGGDELPVGNDVKPRLNQEQHTYILGIMVKYTRHVFQEK